VDEPCGPVQPGEVCVDLWDFWGSYVAGRYFHNEIEFKLLATADLPSLFAVDFAMNLASTRMSRLSVTYVGAMVWLFVGTLQWWLVGILVESWRVRGLLTPLQANSKKHGD
jgi:hypothetical protein